MLSQAFRIALPEATQVWAWHLIGTVLCVDGVLHVPEDRALVQALAVAAAVALGIGCQGAKGISAGDRSARSAAHAEYAELGSKPQAPEGRDLRQSARSRPLQVNRVRGAPECQNQSQAGEASDLQTQQKTSRPCLCEGQNASRFHVGALSLQHLSWLP